MNFLNFPIVLNFQKKSMYSLLDIFRESYILNEHGISDVETELQVCMLFQMRLMLDFKLVNLE